VPLDPAYKAGLAGHVPVKLLIFATTSVAAKGVIPAKAGIQKNTGFRVKPGMTTRIRLLLPCKIHCSLKFGFKLNFEL
jgi:hypothetical protein